MKMIWHDVQQKKAVVAGETTGIAARHAEHPPEERPGIAARHAELERRLN